MVMVQQQVSRAEVGLRSSRGPILLSMMLSVGLVAIDSTILATAVPAIVDDLGGFSQFPWLFSVFLLAQAVSVPIYAKFSDQYGRKPIMLIGVGLFLLGSILCGFAWSMPALIVFRGLQGLGAGAIMPTSMTIVGDLYTLAERATVQGYMASVWAISAVVGPTLGGVFVEVLDWRWIFFVNVPLALFAGWTLIRRFHEDVERVRHRIDVAGAVLLTVGSSLLILGLLEGGVLWPWLSPASVVVLGSAVLLLVAFALAERRAQRADHPGLGVPVPVAEHHQPGQPGRRRHAGRPDLLRAALRPGRPRPQRPGRRLRPGRADHRLADRGRHRGPGLPADRLPLHRPDRLRRGAGRRRAARHPHRRLLRLAGGASPASWSVSGWAGSPAPR